MLDIEAGNIQRGADRRALCPLTHFETLEHSAFLSPGMFRAKVLPFGVKIPGSQPGSETDHRKYSHLLPPEEKAYRLCGIQLTWLSTKGFQSSKLPSKVQEKHYWVWK